MDVDTFIIPSDCPRFQSGDAKGLVKASTRGDDIYIFVDPGNYSVTYNLFGYENHLSPDDHFQNLIRLIQAVLTLDSEKFLTSHSNSQQCNMRSVG